MLFPHKYRLEMIETTSKMSMKMSCLKACGNDVARAKELYSFLAADMADIPDFDPVRPGTFEQVKQGAAEVFGWLDKHRDDVAQGIAFIQSLRKPAAAA